MTRDHLAGIPAMFDTSGVDVADRLDFWREMTSRERFPLEVDIDAGRDFHGAMSLVELGVVRIGLLRSSPMRLARTRYLIRRGDPEAYQLTVVLAGRVENVQGGRHVQAGPGEMFLRDSSRPFIGHRWDAAGPCTTIAVQFPRSASALPGGALDRLVAVPLSARQSSGALLSCYLSWLLRHAGEGGPAEQSVMAQIVLDLIGAVCARELDREAPRSPEAERRTLLFRVHKFIEGHLADPGLSPQVIADAHRISLRRLHGLFEDQGGLTVAASIRHRRLERCRRDLTDPALADQSIHAIATRWGFTDRAHFSKLFRGRFGMPPGEYRQDNRPVPGDATLSGLRDRLLRPRESA